MYVYENHDDDAWKLKPYGAVEKTSPNFLDEMKSSGGQWKYFVVEKVNSDI
jgi:hypothetical protein